MSSGGRIEVLPGLLPAEHFSVLVHELAHELIRKGERRKNTSQTVRETEAEAVAFVVCHSIGLDTNTAASDYISIYQGDQATLGGIARSDPEDLSRNPAGDCTRSGPAAVNPAL
jgi:hypothetical protein